MPYTTEQLRHRCASLLRLSPREDRLPARLLYYVRILQSYVAAGEGKPALVYRGLTELSPRV